MNKKKILLLVTSLCFVSSCKKEEPSSSVVKVCTEHIYDSDNTDFTFTDDGVLTAMTLHCAHYDYCDHSETVNLSDATISYTSSYITEATCSQDGIKTVTATVTYKGQVFTGNKYCVGIKGTHDYKLMSYKMNDDNTAATIKLICNYDATHVVNATIKDFRYILIKAPTTTTSGKKALQFVYDDITYTASEALYENIPYNTYVFTDIDNEVLEEKEITATDDKVYCSYNTTTTLMNRYFDDTSDDSKVTMFTGFTSKVGTLQYIARYTTIDKDKNGSYDSSVIKWRYLKQDDDKGTVTFISEYALEEKMYDSATAKKTVDTGNGTKEVSPNMWEYSELRDYLNGDFLTKLFKDDSLIMTNSLDNSLSSTGWSASDGVDDYLSSSPLDDKLFLLSYEEATNKKYGFGEPSNRVAYKKGLTTTENAVGYWLRSPGDRLVYARFVNGYAGEAADTMGNITAGDNVKNQHYIRPAVTFKLFDN